ncbi:NAD(P)H-dependent glycerol-3-phosphate dehydrogenase [Microbispora bryophytorum]|uniref:Glycerol-3-phosphate dehydrogenase [NAD(P)+] n=1 Tax=Microbispora bryophytorum TaxID=1460882 RepID=A0A8H9LIF3_9ACTN|nr:NAD(P)H-dependent glycerol-3-phosphate dehydrogenase [Microbispora bryophytorum]MBD3138015.1 NAD(P)-dependent glycerol-3-phosphate dehydrogenase [Microbispora bryophytorum]TQS05229.1 NAD(P)-dependent glycerol-3-phosphate dehydrogenase [Microbispora bryophytorum]GGO22235.1 glycerol-3-phosphate dehydrogenase [NAD(P)+] [Microbispora bryophytorum]
MSRAAVFGTGSWGTTFAMILAEAGTSTTLWGRRAEVVDAINETRENPEYLPGTRLPDTIRATTDPAEAMDGADFVVLAVPSQTLRANLQVWKPHIPPEAVLVSLMKGVELGTCRRMSEVVCEVAEVPERRVAVISGPNLVPELAQRQPAAAVIACSDEEVAARLQEACHLPWFRTYTNPDVVGVELGGAVKNVIALAVGVAAGMGLGDNVRATLMTRGLAEIARLGAVLGADQHTFAGLAGMGDLVATCTSPLSRNRTFGENLGRGMTMAEVVAATKQTAEGVKSCESVLELARKHDVEMPITEVVVGVVHDGMTPGEAAVLLMSRTPKPERYGV